MLRGSDFSKGRHDLSVIESEEQNEDGSECDRDSVKDTLNMGKESSKKKKSKRDNRSKIGKNTIKSNGMCSAGGNNACCTIF